MAHEHAYNSWGYHCTPKTKKHLRNNNCCLAVSCNHHYSIGCSWLFCPVSDYAPINCSFLFQFYGDSWQVTIIVALFTAFNTNHHRNSESFLVADPVNHELAIACFPVSRSHTVHSGQFTTMNYSIANSLAMVHPQTPVWLQ